MVAAETLHDGIAEARGHTHERSPGNDACVSLRLVGGLLTPQLNDCACTPDFRS